MENLCCIPSLCFCLVTSFLIYRVSKPFINGSRNPVSRERGPRYALVNTPLLFLVSAEPIQSAMGFVIVAMPLTFIPGTRTNKNYKVTNLKLREINKSNKK